jgi:hypothetical protein
VTANGAAVCQLPTESTCGAGGTCAAGLACRTIDNTCRSACTSNTGCLTGQTCAGTVCVEISESNPGNDGSAGAGGKADAGAAGAGGGSSGGSDAGVDVPLTSPGDAAGSDGSGGNGSGGTTGSGGAGGTGGTAGAGGSDAGADALVMAVPDATATGGIDASILPTPAPDYVWYVLDETEGTTAHDSSLHHYDITNLAGVTWNSGANFDGQGGGGSVLVDSSYRSPPITVGAWLTPVARSDDNVNPSWSLVPYPTNAFGDDISGQWGYGIGLNVWSGGAALSAEDVDLCQGTIPPPGGYRCIANQNSGAPVVFSGGTEYFVVVAIGSPSDAGTGSSAIVYVNGSLFDSSTAGVISGGTTTLWLGVHNDDTGYGTRRFFSGRIRDARVYKRELGAAEVQQLYRSGPTLHAPRQTGT